MNLTLSIDDQLVERAREVARRQGTSLQELLRAYVATLVGAEASVTEELQRLWQKTDEHLKAHPPGAFKWRREDAYEERLTGFKG
jgi:hypothetical protein